jgi:exo-beta-1,3-glucanase (GH17 family)
MILHDHKPHVYHQLEAVRQTKVDMQVYLGNYNVPNDNNAAYDRQKAEIQNVIQTYGTNHISGVTVGNEYILK